MVDYVGRGGGGTSKKTYKLGEYESFDHLLFLFNVFCLFAEWNAWNKNDSPVFV